MNEIPNIQHLGDACCGCSACASICPVDAITMEADAAGFRYPVVDEDLCIQCQECDITCPSQNPCPKDVCHEAVWAQASDGAILSGSSSGAVIPLVASKVISEGGMVCGAAFSDDCRSVAHVLVDTQKNLSCLQGSKYLQSIIDEEDLRYLKRRAEAGVSVLYIGTPCQVAGFNKFMGAVASQENVASIDVFCHGVPSPTLWRRYYEWLENALGSDITGVSFRDKSTGWQNYSFDASTKEGRHREVHSGNWFMKAFLSDTCLRPQCFQCTYKRSAGSDLTVGDFWGFDPEAHDCPSWDKGVSAVLVNTAHGASLIESLSCKMLSGPSSFDEIVRGNPSLVGNAQPGEHYAAFMAGVKEGMTANQLMEKWPFAMPLSQKMMQKARSVAKRLLGRAQ